MFVLRHGLLFALASNKQINQAILSLNTQIYFRAKQWLWMGLVSGTTSPLLVRVRGLSSDVQKVSVHGENEDRREIKAQDVIASSTQTRTQRKQGERVVLSEKDQKASEKKTRKKRALQSETRSTIDDDAHVHDGNEFIHSKDLWGASLSFPFDGSSYTEVDDEFNMHHHTPRDVGYSEDNSLVQRIDGYNSKDRFYHIVSSVGTGVLFPSVTTVLSNTPTRSQYYRLRNWKKSMIKKYGEEQFENFQQQTKDAGTQFHQELEKKLFKLQSPDCVSIKPHQSENEKWSMLPSHFHGVPSTWTVHKPSPTKGAERTNAYEKQVSEYIKSIEHVLKQTSCVVALESVVTHHELGYTGTCDCVVKYRDEVCLIDWKSSLRPKPTLDDCYDFPLQAVAYAGAINHDDRYPFKVFSVLIVVAYADGTPAHTHFLSHKECQYYWSKWLDRLQEYQTLFSSDHSNVYY